MTKEEFFLNHYNCKPADFNWKANSYNLCYLHSEYFLLWWDPEKFDWKNSSTLCWYNTEHFSIWYDPDKFNWNEINYLKIYCSKYKDIWGPDYILKQIT